MYQVLKYGRWFWFKINEMKKKEQKKKKKKKLQVRDMQRDYVSSFKLCNGCMETSSKTMTHEEDHI